MTNMSVDTESVNVQPRPVTEKKETHPAHTGYSRTLIMASCCGGNKCVVNVKFNTHFLLLFSNFTLVFGLRVRLMGTHCGGESGRGPKSVQTVKDDTLLRPTAKAKTLQRMSRRRGNTHGC